MMERGRRALRADAEYYMYVFVRNVHAAFTVGGGGDKLMQRIASEWGGGEGAGVEGGEEEGKDKYASTHESEINVLITQRRLIGDYHASLDT